MLRIGLHSFDYTFSNIRTYILKMSNTICQIHSLHSGNW